VSALIRWRQAKLRKDRWVMDDETREMISETIKVLRRCERLSRLSGVERQAEAIRIAKQGGAH